MAHDAFPEVLSGPPVYKEQQRFRQWWLWLIVLGASALGWWALIEQILLGQPFGSNPAPDWGVWVVWAFVGLGLPLLFVCLRLVIEVSSDQILIRFRPLTRRVIRVSEIEQVEVRTYSAISEYGGWGIKGWSRKNLAYSVSGNRGVQLTLRDGRRVLLGSRRPEELALAIEGQRGSRGRAGER